MQAARIFLGIVGAVYVALGVWCAVLPAKTSRAVGLELAPGGGQSEFLSVYGGLEIGLGACFLYVSLRQNADVRTALLACAFIHGGIVVARTASLLLYRPIPPMTYAFALTEWLILGGAAWMLRKV